MLCDGFLVRCYPVASGDAFTTVDSFNAGPGDV